jgi:hypothetical protein
MQILTMLIFFSGKGEQIGAASGFIRSRAEGAVLSLASAGGAGAIATPAQRATFDTVVMVQGNRTWEAGRVAFPEIDSHLDVDTVSPGSFSMLDNGHSAGSISWRVIGGGGRFAGASGVVTGNFIGNPDGSFTDHQLFKLQMPGATSLGS